MIKVITYGTYDLLHRGHIRLLERARALGDYLIVGITADDFDKNRGKINVQQSLMERIDAVKATGLADKIIVEEYEGQKIDDIRKYDVDIFTVGSDWKGKFDYLNEYCKVVYLDRTKGVSSTSLRTEQKKIRLGLLGKASALKKIIRESSFVNGIEITAVMPFSQTNFDNKYYIAENYDELLAKVDAVYIVSLPNLHYFHIKKALLMKKHVLCEAPICLSSEECQNLQELSRKNACVLMEGIKTAYSTAYNRLILLAKEGKIGHIYSIDATCTSLREMNNDLWDSICCWGPTALLPIFNLFGTKYKSKTIMSHKESGYDVFTKIDFVYDHSVASLKVGSGVKSEGELIISGTKGYIYVPAPWWKTDYFEIRYEDTCKNERFFYQLEGEGIRYEVLSFVNAISKGKKLSYIDPNTTLSICKVVEDFYNNVDVVCI